MIDGFGWFERADFLRAWLFFDEVDYILPRDPVAPLVYTPQVFEAREHRVTYTDLDEARAALLVERSRFDAKNPGLRALVDRVPARDRTYALAVVRCDRELSAASPPGALEDPAFAISLLLNKLILHAAQTGAVPIFGRRYAAELLASKLEVWRHERGRASGSGPATPRQALAYAAFSTGLSLGLVPDTVLVDTPFPALEDFKREHLPLLERHQLHLLGVAERFRGLPAGPDFEERLDQLRAEVERERHSLELGAREAWSRARAELTKGALVAGSTAMVTGLAVLRGFSLFELLSTVVPAAAAGLSTTAASAWEEVRRARRAKVHDLAYLFAAQSWLGPSRSPRR